jgi:hypothetical protein
MSLLRRPLEAAARLLLADARLGYVRAARENAPEAIRRKHEFAELCPSSSASMVKDLPPRPLREHGCA